MPVSITSLAKRFETFSKSSVEIGCGSILVAIFQVNSINFAPSSIMSLKSLEIIALQQPVSQDLRTVITVLKASSDVERMADHAASIAKATIRVKGEERLPEVEAEIKKMGKAVRSMVEEALDVYITGDEERAYEVAALDEVVDNYFRDIQNMAVESIRHQPDAVFAGKEYFQVITYLERIGDYARNICEWVVYLKTGKIIKIKKKINKKEVNLLFVYL